MADPLQPPLASARHGVPPETWAARWSSRLQRVFRAGLGGAGVGGLAWALGSTPAAGGIVGLAAAAMLLGQRLHRDARLLRCLAPRPGGGAPWQQDLSGDPVVHGVTTWMQQERSDMREAQRRIEAAAESHRLRAARMQETLQQQPAPVLLWDGSRRGRVWWANRAALANLPGRVGPALPEDVIGQPIGEVLTPVTVAALAAAGGVGDAWQERIRDGGACAAGDLPWGPLTVDAVVFALQGGDGAPPGLGLTWQTADDSDSLQRAKDAVLSCVSHELRTPLTNVQAYAELLQGLDPGDRDEHREFTDVLVQESNRMANRIERIMDLARLQSGQVRWGFEPFELGPWLGGRLRTWRRRMADRGQELLCMASGDAGHAVVDPRWLERILDELLQNAHAHAATGGRVVCELHGEQEVVHLSVHDDGDGVPEPDRSRLGAAFEQGGGREQGKPDGLGLGLALVERVVAHHGGQIWLDESPLGGLAAHILLPRAAHRVATPSAPVAAQLEGRPEGAAGATSGAASGVAKAGGDATLRRHAIGGQPPRSVTGPLTQR